MSLSQITVVITVVALLAGFQGMRLLYRVFSASGGLRRLLSLQGALVLLVLSTTSGLLVATLATFHGLRDEPIGEIRFSQRAPQHFDALLIDENGRSMSYALNGDQWQVDARIIRWHPQLAAFGLKPLYRFERLSGRYLSIADERENPRSVYQLNVSASPWAWWAGAQQFSRLPLIHSLFGGSVYLPMADNAVYTLSIASSGIVATPANQQARNAIGTWR